MKFAHQGKVGAKDQCHNARFRAGALCVGFKPVAIYCGKHFQIILLMLPTFRCSVPFLCFVCSLWLLGATTAFAASPATLDVFAAASLRESLGEAAALYERESGQSVRVTYAGSSALARQIEQGAPADVFISADLDWMDWLQTHELIDQTTRSELLGNALVLIAPASAAAPAIDLKPGIDLMPLLGDGRIALALTASVPAGKYAKAGFESLGIWPAVQVRVAEAENVRAALLLVARGEAPLGVVYASDAKAEPRVQVLASFPAGSHPAIIYPVATLRASRHPKARAFVEWLQQPAALDIFRQRGFVTP